MLPIGAWPRTAVFALASIMLYDAVRHRVETREYLPHLQFLLVSLLCFTIVGLLVYIDKYNIPVQGVIAEVPKLLTSKQFNAYSIAVILMLNIEKVMKANIDDTFVLGAFYIVGALKRL